MKIIFLDIDGPMIPLRCFFMLKNYKKLATAFDPIAVEFFNTVLKKNPDVHFVISSTWGLKGKETIKKLFKKNGLLCRLHKDWVTPRKLSSLRSSEIRWWLEDHPEIETFVVVDDELLTVPNHVRACTKDGLKFEDYKKILDLLNTEY